MILLILGVLFLLSVRLIVSGINDMLPKREPETRITYNVTISNSFNNQGGTDHGRIQETSTTRNAYSDSDYQQPFRF